MNTRPQTYTCPERRMSVKSEIMARPEMVRVRTLRNRDSSFLMAEVLILCLIRDADDDEDDDAVIFDVLVAAAVVDDVVVVVSLLLSSSN